MGLSAQVRRFDEGGLGGEGDVKLWEKGALAHFSQKPLFPFPVLTFQDGSPIQGRGGGLGGGESNTRHPAERVAGKGPW